MREAIRKYTLIRQIRYRLMSPELSVIKNTQSCVISSENLPYIAREMR